MARLINADELWKHKFKSASERMDLNVAYMGGWNDAIDLIDENAPTVEAIPIEWIKKWCGNEPYWSNLAIHLIDDWGKENGNQS